MAKSRTGIVSKNKPISSRVQYSITISLLGVY
nr:MAG TPA_asm: hypothetical protein [Caudoviricetes sp.]